jgi:hypothetical protein
MAPKTTSKNSNAVRSLISECMAKGAKGDCEGSKAHSSFPVPQILVAAGQAVDPVTVTCGNHRASLVLRIDRVVRLFATRRVAIFVRW